MDIQTISITVGILTACITVIIGVISFIRSNRRAEEQRGIELKNQEFALQAQQHTLETRQAELFAQLHTWWRSREAIKAYGRVRYHYYTDKVKNNLSWSEYFQKYGSQGNIEAYTDQMTLWAFFEGVGVLVKKGLIDVELVENLLSQRMIWMWENIIGPNADRIRESTGDPTQYDHIEYLYNMMKQRQQSAVST